MKHEYPVIPLMTIGAERDEMMGCLGDETGCTVYNKKGSDKHWLSIVSFVKDIPVPDDKLVELRNILNSYIKYYELDKKEG